jgi:hypothetical protein
MPYSNVPDELKDKMDRCVQKVEESGKDKEAAIAICYSAVVEGKGEAIKSAADYGFAMSDDIVIPVAVKATGDWELEIRAVPYGIDRDGQSFDANTDYMLAQFQTPVITYHHGMKPGATGIQNRPVIIGKTTSVEQRTDGIWIRVLLDKTLDFARRVWEAAKKGLAVASSDSIAHLARLEVNGRQIFYEKDRKGRIAVWPLAGVSLWDSGNGNFLPASPNAIALPAMKAIYREAGLVFPEIIRATLPEAEKSAEKRAGTMQETQTKTQAQAWAYLITLDNE